MSKKEGCAPLKYLCFQPETRNQMLEICENHQIKQHLNDLYDLIFYQMKEMDSYRSKIIAMKHTNAWAHYEKQDCSKSNRCDKKCGGC